MSLNSYQDWGEISGTYDQIIADVKGQSLEHNSEAQTRFDVIDRFIREVLQWRFGKIAVEEFDENSPKKGYVDYILRQGDYQIIIEAKKFGAAFPSFTKKKRLKLSGSILSSGEIKIAIDQAEAYAINKGANIVCVTNGRCWCFYHLNIESENTYAHILYPLDSVTDAEALFNLFSLPSIEANGLNKLLAIDDFIVNQNILINTVSDADARLGRNTIADHIAPALEHALHGESLIGDVDKLRYCFVNTDTRTKYDNTLNIYINDIKPNLVLPAKRIKRSRAEDELGAAVRSLNTGKSVPVTLLLGPVGAGKSTYLSHFELINGKDLLKRKKVFWIYIDFEKMGRSADPKKFIYNELKEASLQEHPYILTDFEHMVRPAYEDDIKSLARGPFGISAKNKELFQEKIQELIEKDFIAVEPYIDKIFSYISREYTCVIVLDNIDLYEDANLEVGVFSEGVALSKRLGASVMVAIRDTTYIKHKNQSVFNAFELRKFWLDPPPFREVLSRRLKFAGTVLKNKKVQLEYNHMKLNVLDLSVFFEIAHTTLLKEKNARFIESIADGNIRKGVTLVSNFLSSAHIQADRAIYNYLSGASIRELPFHEVFKGCVLGPWKYYREDRADVVNILNSGFNSRSLQLMRLYCLKFLNIRAMDKNTLSTSVQLILDLFRSIGATDNQIVSCLDFLVSERLVRVIDSESISPGSAVSITMSGSYYVSYLVYQFEYLESILYDTPIFAKDCWDRIKQISAEIQLEDNIVTKVSKRCERIRFFYDYLDQLEKEVLSDVVVEELKVINSIESYLMRRLTFIQKNAKNYYG